MVAGALGLALPGFVIALGDGAYLGNGTDLYSYQLPMRRLVRSLLATGQWPTWNPYILAGVPLHGALQLGLTYPPNWLLFIAEPAHAAGWLIALHLSWLALGGAVLANIHAARPALLPGPAALVTAALLAGSGPTWGHIWPGHLSFVEAWSWTPWLIAGCLAAVRHLQIRTTILAAVAVALQLLAGHPQVTYLSLVAMLAVVCSHLLDPVVAAAETDGSTPTFRGWRLPRWLTAALIVGAAVGAGAALAAVQLLPTWLLSPLLNRTLAQGSELALSFSAPPRSLLTAIAPAAYGGPTARLSNFSYHETLAHIGAAGLALAAVAGLRLRRRTIALLLMAGAMVLLSMGRQGPLLEALLPIVPGMGSFRVPSRWLLPATVIVALLAGEVAARWLASSQPIRSLRQPLRSAAGVDRSSRVGAAILAALALSAGAAAMACSTKGSWWSELLDPRRLDRADLAEIATRTRLSLWLFAVACTLAASALLKPAWRRRAAAALVALLVIESLAFGFRHSGADARRPLAAVDWPKSTAAALTKLLGSGRVATAAALRHANWGGAHGLRSAGGYETAVPAWTNRYANRFAGRREGRYAVNLQVRRPSPWLDRFATSHFLRHQRDQRAARAFSGWPVAARLNDQLVVHRNPTPMPRLSIPGRLEVVADRASALARLGTLERGAITVDRPMAHAGEGGTLRLLIDEPTEVSADVQTTQPQVVILRDVLLDGWTVTLDDQPAEQALADGLFRAVAVPAGKHRLRWTYRAPGLATGSAVSFATMLLLALAWVRSGRRRRSGGAAEQTDRVA